MALLALAGCQPASGPRPVPSVAQNGADLKCASGDDPFEDQQAGWGFCHPGSWKYQEHSQPVQGPTGLDLVLDVVNDPCGRTGCTPGEGDFALMIISTYERGSASSLSDWLRTNLKSAPTFEPIAWANAQEAGQFKDGRRIALTPNHVVVMDLHSGRLDLEAAMAPRLSTWKFLF